MWPHRRPYNAQLCLGYDANRRNEERRPMSDLLALEYTVVCREGRLDWCGHWVSRIGYGYWCWEIRIIALGQDDNWWDMGLYPFFFSWRLCMASFLLIFIPFHNCFLPCLLNTYSHITLEIHCEKQFFTFIFFAIIWILSIFVFFAFVFHSLSLFFLESWSFSIFVFSAIFYSFVFLGFPSQHQSSRSVFLSEA